MRCHCTRQSSQNQTPLNAGENTVTASGDAKQNGQRISIFKTPPGAAGSKGHFENYQYKVKSSSGLGASSVVKAPAFETVWQFV